MFLRFHHQVLFVFERRDLCDSHNGERPFSNTHRLSLQWFSILYYVFCNLYFVYYDLQPILTHTDYHSSNLVFCISKLLLCIKFVWNHMLCARQKHTQNFTQTIYFSAKDNLPVLTKWNIASQLRERLVTFFGQFHSFTLSRKVVWIDKYLPGGDLSSFYRAIKC